MYIEFLLLLAILIFVLYKWLTKNYDSFEKRGIPYLKPVPVFGSLLDFVLRRKALFDLIIDYYQRFDSRVFGLFDQRKTLLVIKDPAIIKQITVKDFDHFVNHRPIFGAYEDEDEGNVLGNSLFSMTNAKWKDMRSTLSPAFTGSKMRLMFQLINQVAEDTFDNFKKLPGVESGLEMDIKDYTTRFTNDVIASTAFGLNINSVSDRDNEFFRMGKRLTTFTAWQNIKFLFYPHMKSIMKFFKMQAFDGLSSTYFKKLVIGTMKYRKDNNIVRPDMINMLMEASGMIKSENENVKEHNWSESEIVAQCLIFFFAGFETVSVLLCFTAHELMENPEIQEKLYKEIKEVSEGLKPGEKLSYEKLHSMKYLDMVVSESLRKWPPGILLDRTCNKDFVYTTEEGQTIEIKNGDGIWVPVAGIHRDPKIYENPEKFDPERFSDENVHKIDPFTFIPFGLGPRICIANRFALLEAKSYIFHLLRAFKLEPAKRTQNPIKLYKGTQMRPQDGFWLKLILRNEVS